MGNDFYGPNSGAAAQSATTLQREEEDEGGSEIEFPSTSTSRKKKTKEEKFSPLDLMEPFKKEEKENPPLPPLRKIFSIQMLPGGKNSIMFLHGHKNKIAKFHRISENFPKKIFQNTLSAGGPTATIFPQLCQWQCDLLRRKSPTLLFPHFLRKKKRNS